MKLFSSDEICQILNITKEDFKEAQKKRPGKKNDKFQPLKGKLIGKRRYFTELQLKQAREYFLLKKTIKMLREQSWQVFGDK